MKRIIILVAGGVVTTVLVFVAAFSVMYLMSGGRTLGAGNWVEAACLWAVAWPLPLTERVFGTFANAFSDHAPTPAALLAALLCHVATYSALVYAALWLRARRRRLA